MKRRNFLKGLMILPAAVSAKDLLAGIQPPPVVKHREDAHIITHLTPSEPSVDIAEGYIWINTSTGEISFHNGKKWVHQK